MDQAIITVISLVGTTILTLAVTSIYNHIVNHSKKAIKRREEQRRGELKILFDEFSKPIIDKLDDAQSKLDKVANGTRNSLRTDILKYYYDCLKKGYRTEKDTKTFEGMFNSYVELGGNSFIKTEISPNFHNEIPYKTEKEVYEIEHIRKSNKEEFDKKLELVISRSMNCPLQQTKAPTKKKKSKSKKQLLLEDNN